MLKWQIGFAAASVFLFAILQIFWPGKSSGRPRTLPPLFWGVLFAALYLYGLPLWWWRYGLRNALKLLLACGAASALPVAALRLAGWLDADAGEARAYAMLLAIPIRAIAGFWLARNDARWVAEIAAKRRGTSGSVD